MPEYESIDPNASIGPWSCGRYLINTPGNTIAAATAKVSTHDLDYVLTSEDLTEYLSAIGDALFNKMVKNGIKNIKDELKPEDKDFSNRTGNDGGTLGEAARISNDRGYGAHTQNTSDLQILNASTSLSASRTTNTKAQTENNQLVPLLENDGVIQTPKGLVACYTSIDPNGSNPGIAGLKGAAVTDLATAKNTWKPKIVEELTLITTSTAELTTIQALQPSSNRTARIATLLSTAISSAGRATTLENAIALKLSDTKSKLNQYCPIAP